MTDLTALFHTAFWGAATTVACLAVWRMWLSIQARRQQLALARLLLRLLAPGKSQLIAELHRPAPTAEELQAMYDASPGEDTDR